MKFFKVLLIFHVIRGDVFGEVGFAEFCDGFMEGEPVEFFDEADDVVLVEVALSVNGFLDLD